MPRSRISSPVLLPVALASAPVRGKVAGSPGLREVLAVLVLSHPLHREAMGCLLHLEQRRRHELEASGSGDAEDGLMKALLGALPLLDQPVAALLAPMARCGDILRRRLREKAPEELMAILDVLEPVG